MAVCNSYEMFETGVILDDLFFFFSRLLEIKEQQAIKNTFFHINKCHPVTSCIGDSAAIYSTVVQNLKY
jgi:hypothetical protein